MFVILMMLMGFSVFRTFKNILFGSGDNKKTQQRKQSTRKNKSQQSRQQQTSSNSKKKIFAKDEGEYVDYEEIK
jgi:hypothetical protein